MERIFELSFLKETERFYKFNYKSSDILSTIYLDKKLFSKVPDKLKILVYLPDEE